MALHRNIARALLGGMLWTACAAPAATPPVIPATAPADPCIIGSGGRDTVAVALESGRAVAFRQAQEIPVWTDCRGTPRVDSLAGPVIEYRISDSGDLRDLLAAGADLAVTSDPGTIDYAERLAAFTVAPLPWNRTYLLVSPYAPVISLAQDSAGRAQFRAELARDVVSAAARGAELTFAAELCRDSTQASAATALRRRVVYPAGDPTARELAERIVALGGAGLTLSLADPGTIDALMLQGAGGAFVIPRPLPDLCAGAPVLPAAATVEPLVDTRAHLILRQGAARVSIDADGTPRILPPEAP